MDIIDFHSHILPNIDDGSRDVEESIQLLKMLSEQNVKTVIATPHFHANTTSLPQFLHNREMAYKKLLPLIDDSMPEIILGAEVKYYDGISHMDDLRELCVRDTDVLLLEMTNTRWSDYTVKELVDLACSNKVKVVLAHIERYFSHQSTRTWQRLLDSGIIMQVNATYLTSIFSRRRALSFLNSGVIHLIGSDCHNVDRRPPYLARAYEIIEKDLGYEKIDDLISFAYSLINR